jgi:hypothetical protein
MDMDMLFLFASLKEQANLVHQGVDSEQATNMLFLSNEETYMNEVQLPQLAEELEERRRYEGV